MFRKKQESESGTSAGTNPTRTTRFRHRWDFLLIAALLLIACTALLLVHLFSRPGTVVKVAVDGQEIGRYSLSEDASYPISGWNGGSNLLVIENGSAFVRDATCPDKLCEHQKKISRSGERIVCLPNRVVVEILSEKQNFSDPDFAIGKVRFPHAMAKEAKQ